MSGRLCPPCGIQEHGFCQGNFDWYVGGYGWPALTSRCGCTCHPAEVRSLCYRCHQPCSPETAAEHRTCRRPHIPYQPVTEETR
ncbi:hypothetical protein [Streptomyces sp. NPDC058373]|uniref:hypothetical protein n=1 Tax=Streptomyces sp. NPDC058373 TaxID=3346465 RepID=UPI00364C9720